ncbi:MAG: protein kinase [Phycisphaerales bacterium JB040]
MDKHIGPYEIESELGRGGMGVVYRARDTRLDRTVAVKALPEELARDPVRLERFEREARTLAQLNHPNIAGIHGLEEHDGHRYLVLEFVEGETLADRLDRGAIEPDEAVELGTQIAAGVGAAHDAGVIHRDLKPGNIMITPEGRAKVLDFGLARNDDGTSSSGGGLSQSPTMTSPARHQHSPTIPGAILGTAAYMSPEQARGRRVDTRTDVWSFGVVLYEMLVGASPFVGETASDSIGAVLHKSFDLDQLPAGTPSSVRRVLRRCLQRDKEQRYRDIGDARLELLSGSVDSPDPVLRSGTGPKVWALAVAAVLVALVGGVGGLLLGKWLPAPAAPSPEPMYVSVPMTDPYIQGGPDGTFFDIDPSGRVLAYVEELPAAEGERAGSAIFVRDLGEPAPRRIPGTEHARKVSFDPTGRHLAYSYEPPDGREWEVRRIALDGRAPTTVFVDPRRYDLGAPPKWLGEDRLMVPGDDGLSVHVVNASGGAPVEVAQLRGQIEGAIFIMDLWGVPTGRYVYLSVYRQSPGGGQGVDVHELDVETGEHRPVMRGAGFLRVIRDEFAVFIRDDAMMVARWDGASRSVVGTPVPAMAQHEGQTATRISHTGVFALAVAPVENELVRVMSVTRDREVTPVTTSGRTFGGHVIVSPDGRRLALGMWDQDLRPKVFALDLDTRYLREIGDGTVAIAPHWLPDGRFVYVKVSDLQDQQHWAIDLDTGGSLERVFETDEPLGLSVELEFTSDGELAIVNVADPVTGESDLYALDAATLDRTPLVVSASDTRQGRLSPDDRLITYLHSEANSQRRIIMRTFDRATLALGPPIPVAEGQPGPAMWSADGSELFWYDDRLGQILGARVDYPADAPRGAIGIGPPEVLFERSVLNWQRDWSDFPIGVSPDAQTFYYVENRASNEDPGHVSLILDWHVEVERLLARD